MWSALENMALRENLPTPLQAGDSVHDILVAGQIPGGRHRIHHLGYRRSRPYFLKQYYSLDTDAFLRWQNEARFIGLPETDGFAWPIEEWRGGLITPHPGGIPLARWLVEEEHSLPSRLAVTARLAERVAALHASGFVHRRLTPASIHIHGLETTILDFGHAHHQSWDDLWRDTIRYPGDMALASPEALDGVESGFMEDIYALGGLVYLLLAGRPPLGKMKLHLRHYVPGLISPAPFPDTAGVPAPLAKAIDACLATSPSDRPNATEITHILSNYANMTARSLSRIIVHEEPASETRRERIMVFIKDDHRAVSLVDRTLEIAQTKPSLFLFVGMIPGNLPSGHLERFKGRLFQNMAHGLTRCRLAGAQWSLRVLEDTVPETSAQAFIEAYAPDRIIVGKTTSRRSFSSRLEGFGIAIDSIG